MRMQFLLPLHIHADDYVRLPAAQLAHYTNQSLRHVTKTEGTTATWSNASDASGASDKDDAH